MTLFAGKSRMCTRQGIAGVFQVVKAGAEPTVHRMAAFASGRKLQTNVVNDRRQEVFLVAGVACRRQPAELS